MLKKIYSRTLELSFSMALELAKLFKFGFYIVGSKAAFFSLSQALAPISGLFANKGSNTIIFIFRTIITLFVSKFGVLTSLLYHFPTFCGALYFSSNSKLLKIAIPVLCMTIFISHPIGSQAFLYSFYWIIPMAITILNLRSILAQAIASTFTTHAVGTIIYLYTHNISAATWNSLIAIVWAERLAFALTITAVYYIVVYVSQKIKSYKNITIPTNNLNYINNA